MAIGTRSGFILRYLSVFAPASLVLEFAHMPLYTLWQTGTFGEIAFALLLLLGEHRTHLLGLLLYLILLACPFLHLFMHKGHGTHSGHQSHSDADQRGGNRHEP